MELIYFIFAFSLYWMISALLFYFPKWLHTPRPKKQCPLLHGSHRGGAAERPENTLQAFRHAIQQGTELLELDCYLTVDGHVVVVHDDELTRLCGSEAAQAGTVRTRKFSDLPSLLALPTLPIGFHGHNETLAPYDDFAVNRSCLGCDNVDSIGQHMPLLEDVFEAFPEATINIDCKHESVELVEKVVTLVRKFKRVDRSIVGAFSTLTTNRLRACAPELQRIFSARETLALYLGFLFGLLPFMSLSGDYLEVPLPSTFFLARFKAAQIRRGVAWPWRLLAALLLPVVTWLMTQPRFYRHLQQRGVRVVFWVLNEPTEFVMALDELGADGIMTDYPSRLSSFLKTRCSRE